jgi:hypothetical protein
MTICIHQPEHLPWMGLIHKIAISDIYVVLDNVQFKKNYFENRNKIYTHQGWNWITAPVKTQGHISKKFFEMELLEGWKRKYFQTLTLNYSKAPYRKDLESVFAFIEGFNGNSLADYNLGVIQTILKLLHIRTSIVRAKEMSVTGSKTDLLIDIIMQLKGSTYLVGKSGFDYMDLPKFEENNIQLLAHKFTHPKYIPFNYSEMTDYPSILDVIANIGAEKCIEHIAKQ